ncbi:DNA-processing protein DprA [Salisediminibacterium beveridgei]|uniref:Rossmann fold nucleotide-binding protein Smf n=1 Tax=Salisediminibacterium beveridgei TaxID=632773 RepID=A0A1D7QW52_9BACI|nr:DNA-processing protein DprA [Salisediminibacterium beveridgei]AOM83199.1 Rossmann fold nucleotide-binding protein Smf [Salisediminibacterium beveridgei]
MQVPKTFRERLIHLHYCLYGASDFLCELLRVDPELTACYQWSTVEWASRFPKRGEKMQNASKALKNVSFKAIKTSLEQQNIDVITVEDELYPKLLKEVYDPPLCLYTKGNHALLAKPSFLGVVGTRWPSPYASKAVDFILGPVCIEDIVIVSGMAEGVDTLAHQKAMSMNAPTIAVTAFGFDHLYPSKLRNLYEKLQSEQLVISEYPPYMKAEKWHFPKRNRIISGLCQAVLVVEAKKRSGSLITADCAMNESRDVMAIPGPLDNPSSEGANRLIQQGAKCILTGEDILLEYPDQLTFKKKNKEVSNH